MGLLDAKNLIWLIACPLLGAIIYLRLSDKEKRLAFFAADFQKLLAKRALIAIPLLIIVVLIMALTRPHVGSESTKLKLYGRDIIAVVDVSLSMLTKDVPPNRLTFAKRKLIDLLEIIKHESAGDRLGIVIYAGDSQLFSPLTSDYGVLKLYIDALSTKLIQSGGSDIEGAIDAAIKSLESTQSLFSEQNKNPVLLLISDGEDNDFGISTVLNKLKEVSLPLFSLGIGSLEGKPIELDNGSFMRDRHGDTVISRLKEDNLKRVAVESGGQYQKATLDDSDIKSILTDSSALQTKSSSERDYTVYKEIGPFILAALLVAIALAFGFRREPLLFPLVLFIILTKPLHLNAEEVGSAYEAQQAYESGDFENAKLGFKQALENDPNNVKLLQGLASSEFRLKNFEEASKLYTESFRRSKTGRDKFNSLYNLGNSFLASQKPKEAIEAYDQALNIKPSDEKATFNREIAKRMLENQASSHSSSASSSSSSADSQSSESTSASSTEGSSSDSSNAESSETSGQTSSTSESEGSQSESSGTSGSGASSKTEGSEENSSSGSGESQERSEGSEGSSDASSASPTENQTQASALPTHDPVALKEQEAKAWLDSLSDSPIITYKNQKRTNRNQAQDW